MLRVFAAAEPGIQALAESPGEFMKNCPPAGASGASNPWTPTPTVDVGVTYLTNFLNLGQFDGGEGSHWVVQRQSFVLGLGWVRGPFVVVSFPLGMME